MYGIIIGGCFALAFGIVAAIIARRRKKELPH